MTVKEVCKRYHLTPDTLRYYEKAGVIPPVGRTRGGARHYTEADLAFVETAVCLRQAGVPVTAVAEYVKLYRQGDDTFAARLALLEREQAHLQEQKERLEKTLNLLNYKIGRYRVAVETGVLCWDNTEKERDT